MFAIHLNFSPRQLFWALIASLLLHAIALWSAQRHLVVPDSMLGAGSPLEARLVTARTASTRPARPHRTVARPAENSAQLVSSGAGDAAPAQPPSDAAGVESPPGTDPQNDAKPPPEPPQDLAAAVPDVALTLPKHGRIRFAVLHGSEGFEVGQAVHEWHHDGTSYVLTGTTEATGLVALFRQSKVVQTSVGRLNKGELQPTEFKVDRGGGDVESATFDWERQVVVLKNGQEFSIAGGAQDLLSMFYQLTQVALRGAGFQMAVATGRKVERYAFEWLDEEDLALKAGHFHTWHVRVRAASGGNDITEVWLGQQAAGLPVKIRHTDRKGEIFDQVAEEIEYEGQ